MIKDITKIVESKINELGFNFDIKSYLKKEMISISLNEEDSKYFPTYDCEYYSNSQTLGTFKFQVRFSIDNCYIEVDLENLSSDVEIHILL